VCIYRICRRGQARKVKIIRTALNALRHFAHKYSAILLSRYIGYHSPIVTAPRRGRRDALHCRSVCQVPYVRGSTPGNFEIVLQFCYRTNNGRLPTHVSTHVQDWIYGALLPMHHACSLRGSVVPSLPIAHKRAAVNKTGHNLWQTGPDLLCSIMSSGVQRGRRLLSVGCGRLDLGCGVL